MLWGAHAVILDYALGLSPFVAASFMGAPLAATAVNDGLGSLWMGGLNAFLGRLRELPRALRSRGGLLLVIAALCGGPIATASYITAIRLVGPAYAVTVTAVFPAVGAVLARIFLKDRVRALGWSGIVLAIMGAAVAAYAPPAGDGAHQGLGTMFACIAAVGWGVEGVLVAAAARHVKPTVALNLYELTSFATIAIVILPAIGATGVAAEAVTSPVLLVLVVASLCWILAYLAFYRCLAIMGASRSLTLFSSYIVWTLLYTTLLSGALPDWRLLVGGAVVISGIALLSMDSEAIEAPLGADAEPLGADAEPVSADAEPVSAETRPASAETIPVEPAEE
jgi:drug/metabolite transporter (DMT)-like permease